MSKGTVCKVTIIGNLGAEPESRETNSGMAITNLRVATTDSRKNKAGDYEDITEWHRVTLFGKMAETASRYLSKGSKVYIEGTIRTDKYQDRNGEDKYSTSIIASDMQMLSRNDDKPRAASKPVEKPDFDDDVPF